MDRVNEIKSVLHLQNTFTDPVRKGIVAEKHLLNMLKYVKLCSKKLSDQNNLINTFNKVMSIPFQKSVLK